ncbi:GNAT family N-acetyltransferase [Candidatus Pacearchaeota archaeon]|nr:GNAT family N-acetyltransferase [Candidatus Pacearchaeota archaeon]
MKDAKDIAENANDKEIGNFTTVPYPYSIKNAGEFIKKKILDKKKKPRETYAFGITIKDKNKIIGVIGLANIDKNNKKAEIGYWIGKKYRKQGIVSEAEKTVLDFGFNKLKLNKIFGKAMPENMGSNKLFKKFKFRKVGLLKEDFIKNGKKKDGYLWELLKSGYKR